MSNDELLMLGQVARSACAEIFGGSNVKLITRIIDDDGQVDVDLGYGLDSFHPNSDWFYRSEESDKYDKARVARVVITAGGFEIEGNRSSYYRDFNGNTGLLKNSLKKHLKECVSL